MSDATTPGVPTSFHRAATVTEVEAAGALVVPVGGETVALFAHQGRIYAVDNRCPHMGFPLHRGSCKDGILTCHWHHARFDLASGGAFDLFADDARAFPVELRDGEVWVDVTPREDPAEHQRRRLADGLERDLPLVLAKTAVALCDLGTPPDEPFAAALRFGVAQRRAGWGQGLTMLVCLQNLLPRLDAEDRPRALYHGLAAVARDSAGSAPRFPLRPLPSLTAELPTLKRWFREFVQVRDAEGAERCLVSAVRAGGTPEQLTDLLFSAATDHRYLTVGHVADFTNKAIEALELTGWQDAEAVLGSLAPAYAGASRMEEANAWRNPIDLVALLVTAFEALPAALEVGRSRAGGWQGADALVPVLLDDQPAASIEAMLTALREGATPLELAGAVCDAAALRIARFHTANEFGDWDTALHTFTFANAMAQAVHRAPSAELLRGVFDGAMSVYLDRFLNIPAARLPQANQGASLDDLLPLLDGQQQVAAAAELVTGWLGSGGDPDALVARLGKALLREDRDFHTIQMLEAAARRYTRHGGTPAGTVVLVAAARYLAAHAPTRRSQDQTYRIADRLHRGERLFEEE